jgi:hypothetical protein
MMKDEHGVTPAALAVTMLILGAIGIASGQIWEKKPYQEWSKGEVEKLLTDSPWAQQHTQRLSKGGDAGQDATITVRLRSALPIRQAVVRQMQMQAKYEKMSEAERSAFDAKTKAILDCPSCADTYAVTITGRSEQNTSYDPIYGRFRNSTPEQLKTYVFLENDRGDRRGIVHFIPPQAIGGDAVFLFARRDVSGKALLAADDKKLTLRFGESNITSLFTFEFDVRKMLLNGEVAF